MDPGGRERIIIRPIMLSRHERDSLGALHCTSVYRLRPYSGPPNTVKGAQGARGLHQRRRAGLTLGEIVC